MRYAALASVLFSASLTACGGDEESTVTLVKAVENIQCKPDGVTPEKLDAALAAAQVTAVAAFCASDGMDRAFVCGGPAVFLHVIEVPGYQSAAALSLGYTTREGFTLHNPFPC
jgi:hypothetical protein